MAEVAPEKSRGQKFAEQQLLRHGWEQGKGLGRNENGISEAIKVKVKCNKGGIGHKEGEQFTFHWWDHVFNKASSSLQVESDQDGIKVTKTVEDEDDVGISNKKPRQAALAKAKLYGSFVKSGTLLGGQEQPEPKSSNSDRGGGSSSSSSSSSSDEDEEQKLDLSSTTKLSDAQLMKACGGRTAHKGARHGLTMSAKLARLEQQEAEFMAKYGKKSQPPSAAAAAATLVCDEPASPAVERVEEDAQSKQKKKKKKKERSGVGELNGGEVCESPEPNGKPKKKKKKKKQTDVDDVVEMSDVICVENGEAEHCQKTKRKHKKKKNKQSEEEAEDQEETVDVSTDSTVKRKKWSSENPGEEGAGSNGTESSQSEPATDPALVTKQRKAAISLEEAEVQEEESAMKNKRSKRQKPGHDRVNEEELPPKKKKKKKSNN